jgi:hypothetical protein
MFLLLLLIFTVGCQNKHSTKNCIEYIDSLEINLENTTLKVAMIDLAQESNVRPYSIFFDNRLIVLNQRYSFYAFQLDCFSRDLKYERKLNKNGFENNLFFKRAFVFSGNLYGIDMNNQAFRYENKTAKWIKLSNNLPFFNSTPIYENDKYICYSVYYGEWGGYVFFYNKHTGKITFTPAGNAVSLMEQQSGEFHIVSNMSFYSHIKKIENPDSSFILPTDTLNYYNDEWDKKISFRSIMLADTTKHQMMNTFIFDENDNIIQRPVYDYFFWEKLITAGFNIKDENYFITKYGVGINYKKTYLTKIHRDSLVIVNTADRIFSGLRYSQEEITRIINNNIVIDYPLYADEPNRGNFLLLTTFIINDTTLIRINWRR